MDDCQLRLRRREVNGSNWVENKPCHNFTVGRCFGATSLQLVLLPMLPFYYGLIMGLIGRLTICVSALPKDENVTPEANKVKLAY